MLKEIEVHLGNLWNLGGYYALIAQAFCDAHARFKYFEISWPGATADITAYKQTTLYRLFEDGIIPEWVCMVLDEAYASIGGKHLTPYSRHQLLKARRRSIDEYNKLKAFNNILSCKLSNRH